MADPTPMTAVMFLGVVLLVVVWTAAWAVFLLWVTSGPTCRDGKHVYEQRFCGIRPKAGGGVGNAGLDFEVTEMCQLCLFTQRRWL